MASQNRSASWLQELKSELFLDLLPALPLGVNIDFIELTSLMLQSVVIVQSEWEDMVNQYNEWILKPPGLRSVTPKHLLKTLPSHRPLLSINPSSTQPTFGRSYSASCQAHDFLAKHAAKHHAVDEVSRYRPSRCC